MEKKCTHCGKPIINGHHIVADLGCAKYIFCYEERMSAKEGYISKFLDKHLVKYRLFKDTVQKGA